MPVRPEAAMIAGGVVLWLVLGGCGNSDQVIDLMPGAAAGTGGQPTGPTGGRNGANCESDRNCDSPTPYCDRTTRVCVECISDADCADHAICLTSDTSSLPQEIVSAFDAGTLSPNNLGHCIECLRDTDCPNNSWCTEEFWCRN